MAAKLSTPVASFYDGFPTDGTTPQATALWRRFEQMAATREGAALADLFARITAARRRRAVVEIVQALFEGE